MTIVAADADLAPAANRISSKSEGSPVKLVKNFIGVISAFELVAGP